MIDQDLLLDCAADDRKAQFKLYHQSFSLAMSIAYRYVSNKDDAEAMVNTGMYKVFKNIKGFLDKGNDHSAYSAWVSRIMINTLIDDYRKNRKTKEILKEGTQDIEDEVSVDYTILDERLEAEHLQVMLDTLQEMQQKVFNLFVIDGFPHKEIGEMLGIPEGTSKWHLNSARKELALMLNKHIGVAEKTLR